MSDLCEELFRRGFGPSHCWSLSDTCMHVNITVHYSFDKYDIKKCVCEVHVIQLIR